MRTAAAYNNESANQSRLPEQAKAGSQAELLFGVENGGSGDPPPFNIASKNRLPLYVLTIQNTTVSISKVL
jgi:hypothetical protein